ncbi:MAG: hypothetical protein CVV22_01060 [Ignavibacteriae bacterium HGW-Ignavibacteriae-1]|jgi:two-component system phosphate regulon sensor histidine kinase PhoR|nr:MAG: hypothetical protein CVV22_01060 [Ignavibacteriae bacterium HGW-Ignavibacteriae-1]
MKSLSTKIFLSFFLVIIIFTSLILLFTFKTTREHYIETFAKDLRNLNLTIIKPVKQYLISSDYDSLREYINEHGKNINIRLTVVDSTGFVLADSKSDPMLMENHMSRPEFQKALKGSNDATLRYSTTVHDEMLYVAIPIYVSGDLLGIARVSMFLSDIDALTTRLASDIMNIAAVILVLILIGILFFSRKLSKPLTQLSQASRKVALGDFDIKVFIKGRDEINELAVNFNHMTERLKALFDLVTSQKEEYQTVISSIQEGLIVTDTSGKILLSNTGFHNIVKTNNVLNKTIENIFQDEQVLELFRSVLKKKKPQTNEIRIYESYYICSANYIALKNEIVLLFHDITSIKRLETMKKDLVVNVSHELRTPLTAIKGFVETLEDEANERDKHYIEIIKRHTDRLINIVQDLLNLSELEERQSQVMLSKVDLRVLLENLTKIFEYKLSEKNLKLIIHVDEAFPKIKIDPFKMEQVFVNLIDNAIKYTDAGFVKIKIFQKRDRAIIEISDSGVGIPQEHHPRIFERFYTVDKSRSKKYGGTGLGLSIVKHIVLLHHGEINVENNPDGGTRFVISIPIKLKIKPISS